jgi:hypothetical protein
MNLMPFGGRLYSEHVDAFNSVLHLCLNEGIPETALAGATCALSTQAVPYIQSTGAAFVNHFEVNSYRSVACCGRPAQAAARSL